MKLKSTIAVSESGFVFDASSGDSYSLNSSAKKIITLLGEGKTENEIIEHFVTNYDVEKTIFEYNLHDFLSVVKAMNISEE